MERDDLIVRLLGNTGPDPILDAALAAVLGEPRGSVAAYTGDPSACLSAARRRGCLLALAPCGPPDGPSVAVLWPPAGSVSGPLLMLGPNSARAASAALASAA